MNLEVTRSADFVAGVGLCVNLEAQIFVAGVSLDAQISWQAQHFARLEAQISWQAQHFVNLEVWILRRRCTL